MSSDPFDEKASTWDADPAHVERAAAVARCITAAIPLDQSVRMLEYGAGTGLVTEALREQVGAITLADTSTGMRDVVRAKIADGRLAGGRVWDLDLATAEPPGEQFDLIVTVLTLHHVAALDAVLAGFARLVAPGGHLCVVDLDEEDGSFHGEGFAGHHGFARPALAESLAAAGFTAVTFTDCHHIVRDGATYPLFLAVGTVTPA